MCVIGPGHTPTRGPLFLILRSGLRRTQKGVPSAMARPSASGRQDRAFQRRKLVEELLSLGALVIVPRIGEVFPRLLDTAG